MSGNQIRLIPELVELDRILASPSDDEPPCKIATNPGSGRFAEAAAIAGAARPGEETTTVASIPPETLFIEQGRGSSHPALPTPTRVRTRKLQVAVDAALPRLRKPWRYQWRREKLILSFQAAEAVGGVAFSLNLSPGLQNTLSRLSDPARRMANYIGREFRRRLDDCPPYGFAFDVSEAGRLHLHGIVVPFLMEEEHMDTLDEALMAAGGRLKGARIVRQMQNYMTLCDDGLGWAVYAEKSLEAAEQLLGTHKITFISNALKRLSRPGT